jgi:hypothetical protein
VVVAMLFGLTVPWSDTLPWSVRLWSRWKVEGGRRKLEAAWADGRGCPYQVEGTCQGQARPMEVKARSGLGGGDEAEAEADEGMGASRPERVDGRAASRRSAPTSACAHAGGGQVDGA